MTYEKRLLPAAALLTMILIVAVGPAGAQKAAAEKTSPEKAATVNGTIIPRQTLERELRLFTDRMENQGRQVPDAQEPILRNEVLNSLIDQELLYQESRKQNIQIDQKVVEEKYGEIKVRFKTEQEFKEAIAKMEVTEAEIRSQLEKGLAIDDLLKSKVVKDIRVTEAETKKYYDEHTEQFKQAEQVKASHILIQVAPDASDEKKAEAKQKITVVQEKLNKGEEFATVAHEFSEDPGKSNGGDLGFFQRGQMVKPFEDAAFALEAGKVSGVVETQFGYHIIKVNEKKPETTLGFSDVKDELEQHLQQQKIREKIEDYLGQLRQNAKIEKFI